MLLYPSKQVNCAADPSKWLAHIPLRGEEQIGLYVDVGFGTRLAFASQYGPPEGTVTRKICKIHTTVENDHGFVAPIREQRSASPLTDGCKGHVFTCGFSDDSILPGLAVFQAGHTEKGKPTHSACW
ncbi:hypothetical protein V500_00793 [Pseudogymnoascus sp. VKM F-4518 (FW-2643)]|nr:hypothetical protein V500_00793 [Pseudogymnoascus sp. VKM F-4518 (FW-2643)]